MKKRLLVLITAVLTAGFLSAQTFSLSTVDGQPLSDRDTVYGNPGANDIQFDAIFNNNSDNGANIKVSRNIIELQDGASTYFRWVATYGPDTDISTESFFVPAGGSSPEGTFISYYMPQGIIGVSEIEYTFFNVNNEDENVKIVVVYDTSTDAIDEYILRNSFVSDIFPNPVNYSATIKYSFPKEAETIDLRLTNVLGSVVYEQSLGSGDGKVSIDVSGLVEGIYFYSLFINNEKYLTKKLIIN